MILRKESYRRYGPLRSILRPFMLALNLEFKEMFNYRKKKATLSQHKSYPIFSYSENNENKCVSCNLCVEYCPAGSLELEGEIYQSPQSLSFNALSCIYCGLCIDVCPTEALVHSDKLQAPIDSDSPWIFEYVKDILK